MNGGPVHLQVGGHLSLLYVPSEKVSELEDHSTYRNDAERTKTNKRNLHVAIGGGLKRQGELNVPIV